MFRNASVGADAHIGPHYLTLVKRADVGIGPYDSIVRRNILWI